MLRDEEQNQAVFPDRACEVSGCGRKGGGRDAGGLDNVVVAYGRQLCGHHLMEFERSLDYGRMMEAFIAGKGRAA